MQINEIPTTKGTYLLFLRLDISKTIQVGKLGKLDFSSGYYCYVGSAMGPGGVRARIKRHLRIDKKMHWHIDHLRDRTTIEKIIYSINDNPQECVWSRLLQKHSKFSPAIHKFGASDCRCATHLFYSEEHDNFSSLHILFKKTFPNDDINLLEIS
jgi:Uri superfamily endonuclease